MIRALFVAALLGAIFVPSPPVALAGGVAFGLFLPHPWPGPAKVWTKWLLQASVVGLGFGMDLRTVLRAGGQGLLVTAVAIGLTLGLGHALGRSLGVRERVAFLISTGTAICGGSAIAAVGPVIGADNDEISLSLATVFLLNSVALLLFPPIGHALGLGQEAFGLWAALAIHDTSSVVGAAASYGPGALAVGTTVKLARALWILPVAFGAGVLRGSKAKAPWPWFILLFVVAAAVHTAAPAPAWLRSGLTRVARSGLVASLFLIGAGISPAALRSIGFRPVALGVILWLVVSAASLALIRGGLVPVPAG